MSRFANLGRSKTPGTPVDLSTVEGVIAFYTELIIKQAKENLKDSNASYSLSQSIQVEYEVRTTKFGQEYFAIIKGEDYWQFVEDGRGPGKNPPIAPIIQWIKEKETFNLRGKERIGQTIKRGLRKGQKISLTDIIEDAAHGVANHIGTYGTKGTKFISRIFTDDFYAQMNKDFAKALGHDIAVSIVGAINSEGMNATAIIKR